MYPPSNQGNEYPGQNQQPPYGQPPQPPYGAPPPYGPPPEMPYGQQPPPYGPPPQQPYGAPPPGYPPYGYNQYPMQPQQPVNNKGTGCALGCIAAVVLVVVLLVGAAVFFLFIANRVVDTATKLVGDLPVPPANGISDKMGKLDGCVLLTKEDVASFLGNDVKVSKSGSDCNYEGASTAGFLQVTYEYGNHEDFLYQKQIYNIMGNVAGSVMPSPYAAEFGNFVIGKVQDVSGLGDESFWSGSFLVTRKGDKLITMVGAAFSGKNTSTLDVLKGYTQKALGKI